MEYLAFVLFYVGIVLVINGITLLNFISAKEAAIINIFTGLVSLSVCFYSAFVIATPEAVKNATFGLLFGFTYLWVAYNNLVQTDGRGLGWFSLLVAATAAAFFFLEWQKIDGIASIWMSLNWAAWSILWFSFYILNVFNPGARKPVAVLAIGQGIITGWIPGFLILNKLPPFTF